MPQVVPMNQKEITSQKALLDEPSAATTSQSPSRRICGFQQMCSVSIVVVLLVPTALVMIAAGLVTWLLIHRAGFAAVEVVSKQGQAVFIQATKSSILSFTNTIQSIHTVNKPRWVNTTADGYVYIPNGTAFDAYDDVRLTLWTEVAELMMYNGSDVLVAVGFQNGASLAYQSTPTGRRWVLSDSSSEMNIRIFYSETWQQWKERELLPIPPSLWPPGVKYNGTSRPYFKDGVRRQKQGWSDLFIAPACQGLALPSFMPVYHPDGQLKLVAQVQPCVKGFDLLLHTLALTPNTVAFIAETNGKLVASDPGGLALNSSAAGVQSRVYAMDCAGPISQAAGWLIEQFGSFDEIPEDDNNFEVLLDGVPYYLYTGHIRDSYGLHWVVIVAVPANDLMGGLKHATDTAIAIICLMLGISLLITAASTFSIRLTLNRFADRIGLLGKMNLEDAKKVHSSTFLSEVKNIMRSLQETIENLEQIRAFLPTSMLGQLKIGDLTMGLDMEPGDRSEQLQGSHRNQPPTPSNRRKTSANVSHAVGEDGVSTSSSSTTLAAKAKGCTVRDILGRHVEPTMVTLVFIELIDIYHTHMSYSGSDLTLWYEQCLTATMAAAQWWGGHFHRLLGDRFLFSWGAAQRIASQCPKACNAANRMVLDLLALHENNEGPLGYIPHISVVTGTAMYGVLGTASSRDWNFIGPLVGRGAKLASLNSLYGTHVLVDEAVATQCGALFQLTPCGLVPSLKCTDTIELVYELVRPYDSKARDEEWMYVLNRDGVDEFSKEYNAAMAALRKCQKEQAMLSLEKALQIKKDDKHALRLLQRLEAIGQAEITLTSMIDLPDKTLLL